EPDTELSGQGGLTGTLQTGEVRRIRVGTGCGDAIGRTFPIRRADLVPGDRGRAAPPDPAGQPRPAAP
ncbi:hypothetical protein ACWCO9_34350, partial [Streptomyces sp. NPDC001937]